MLTLSPGHRLFERSQHPAQGPRLERDASAFRRALFSRPDTQTSVFQKGGAHASYYFESGFARTLMRMSGQYGFMTIIPDMAVPYVPLGACRAGEAACQRGRVAGRYAVAVRRTYVRRTPIVKVLKGVGGRCGRRCRGVKGPGCRRGRGCGRPDCDKKRCTFAGAPCGNTLYY